MEHRFTIRTADDEAFMAAVAARGKPPAPKAMAFPTEVAWYLAHGFRLIPCRLSADGKSKVMEVPPPKHADWREVDHLYDLYERQRLARPRRRLDSPGHGQRIGGPESREHDRRDSAAARHDRGDFQGQPLLLPKGWRIPVQPAEPRRARRHRLVVQWRFLRGIVASGREAALLGDPLAAALGRALCRKRD